MSKSISSELMARFLQVCPLKPAYYFTIPSDIFEFLLCFVTLIFSVDSLQSPSARPSLRQGAIRPAQELQALTFTPQPRINSGEFPGGLNFFSLCSINVPTEKLWLTNLSKTLSSCVVIVSGSVAGSNVIGVIDGKFENGYLVTVTMGTEQLKGVLYQLLPQNTVSHQTPQQSHGVHPNTWNNSANPQGVTGGVTKRRRRRKKSEIKRRDPAHPKPNRSGYNFFFAEQHARLKPLHPGKDREISRMIGELWNKLNEEEKSVFKFSQTLIIDFLSKSLLGFSGFCLMI